MQTRASSGARRPVDFDETPVNWSHHGSEDEQSTGKNTPPDTAGTIPAQSRSPATDSHAGDRDSPDLATENLSEARDGSSRWTSSANEYRRTPPKTWSTEQVAKFMYDNKGGEAAIEMVVEFPMTGELLDDIIHEKDVHNMLHDEFIITSKARRMLIIQKHKMYSSYWFHDSNPRVQDAPAPSGRGQTDRRRASPDPEHAR